MRALRRTADDGAAAVEFALVLPLLLLIIFGIIDFGRMYNAQERVTEAAREGVRAAVLTPADPAAPAARVSAATTGLSGPVTTTVQQTCPGSNAEVDVTNGFTFVTPLGAIMGLFGSSPSGTYTIHGKGVMTCLS